MIILLLVRKSDVGIQNKTVFESGTQLLLIHSAECPEFVIPKAFTQVMICSFNCTKGTVRIIDDNFRKQIIKSTAIGS